MNGFIDFIRQQGVIGLAIGFMLGGAVSKVTSALVNDIINPLIGVFFQEIDGLKEASFQIGSSHILWGDFVAVCIDFLVIAGIIYFLFKKLHLEKLDAKKA